MVHTLHMASNMERRGWTVCACVIMIMTLASGTDPVKYRSNDTLLGIDVPCSDAEKACFRYNRVLDPITGKCYRLGSRGPCLDSTFLLDRSEFVSGSGKLVGRCSDSGQCADHRFRMAYDGKCYTSNEVFGVFCDVKKGLLGWPYFFGGYECVCEGSSCPSPRYVEQPSESGKCLFPNFRKDLTSNFFPRLPTSDMECTHSQSECFAKGLVSFGTNRECYSLLDNGPCPRNHRLVLDKQQGLEGKISTVCQIKKRCRRGEKFMSHIQRCVNQSEIANVLCPDMHTFTDVFGETVCRFKEEFFEVQLKSTDSGACSIRYNVVLKRMPNGVEQKCDLSNPLDCIDFSEVDPDILDAFDIK